jgi:hypothetical protein
VISALFGEEAIQLTFRVARQQAIRHAARQQAIRRANGFWREDRNTSVAGVLYGRRLAPWSLATATVELIPNPWAVRPMTIDLPWARTWALGDTGELRPGDPSQSLLDLFGLSRDWPGPEAAFERRESDLGMGVQGCA